MVILKALMFVIAGILSLLAMRHMMREMQAVKVKAKAQSSRGQPQMRKLRQDPRTGVYYPEN